MYNIYTGMLKMMTDFHDDGMKIDIRYMLDADCRQLHETYKLAEIAGDGPDLKRVTNLLEWVISKVIKKIVHIILKDIIVLVLPQQMKMEM